LQKDVAQLQKDVAQLQKDVAQLQKDVAQLQKDVAILQRDVSQLQRDMTEMKSDISVMKVSIARVQTSIEEIKNNFATKADLHAAIGSLKGWMLGIAFSIMTLNFGMNFVFYNAIKSDLAAKLTQASNVMSNSRPAPVLKN
jgi:seryl-tRNA synthetase